MGPQFYSCVKIEIPNTGWKEEEEVRKNREVVVVVGEEKENAEGKIR